MDRLDSIRIFKRVAETKSFSATAKELGITQPTVSKVIQSLENELSLSLFRRTTRGLSITPEGQKLYHSGRSLLEHFEQMMAEVKNQKLNLEGEIRISASVAFARLILARSLQSLSHIQPGLRFSFHLSDGFVDLIENNIDLAIRIGESPDSQLKAIRIGTSRRCLYASPEYLKEHGSPRHLEDLKMHRLLYYTRLSDRPMWPLHTKDGEKRPFYFEPYFKTDGSDLMRQAVLENWGIALLPTWMMIEPEKKKQVVRLFEAHSQSPSPIFALIPNLGELTAKQRVLVDHLRSYFETEPELSQRILIKK